MATPEIILASDSDVDVENAVEPSFDVCVSCGLKIRANELECHIASKHLSYYPFCCQSCDMRFPSKRQLMHHAIEDHLIQSSALQVMCDLEEVKHMKLKKMVLACRKVKLASVITKESSRPMKSCVSTTEFMKPPTKRVAIGGEFIIARKTSVSYSSHSDDLASPPIKSRPPTKISRSSPISPPPQDPMPVLTRHRPIKLDPNCENSATSSASNCFNEMSGMKVDDSGDPADLPSQPNVTPKDENVPVANIVSVEVPLIHEFVKILDSKIIQLREKTECKITVQTPNGTSIQLCLIEGVEKNVYRAQKKIEKKMNRWKENFGSLPLNSPPIQDRENSASKSNWANEFSGVKAADSGVPADLLAKPKVKPKEKNDRSSKIVCVQLNLSNQFIRCLTNRDGTRMTLVNSELHCNFTVPGPNGRSIRQCYLTGLENNVYQAQKKIKKLMNEWKKFGSRALPERKGKSTSLDSENRGERKDGGKASGAREKGHKIKSSSELKTSENVRLSEVQYNKCVPRMRKTLRQKILRDSNVNAQFIGKPVRMCILHGKPHAIQSAKRILQKAIRVAETTE